MSRLRTPLFGLVHHKRLLRLSFLLVLTSLGCGAHPSATAAKGDAGPSLNVSPVECPDAAALPQVGVCMVSARREFSRDVAPLFNGCAGEICHGFGGGAISQQVGVPAEECCNEIQMIEPGHPERSYVLMKLKGQDLCGGRPMPLDRPSFTAQDIQAVADWICQGANTSP